MGEGLKFFFYLGDSPENLLETTRTPVRRPGFSLCAQGGT
jgi:hypothetical protein